MDAPDLLPCPFCGDEAKLEEISGVNGAVFSAGCDSHFEEDCPGYQLMTSWPTKKAAAEAWNRRAVPANKALIDDLVGALSALHLSVCGETGFANAVRVQSGLAYPWTSLDIADDMAKRALAKTSEGGK